MNLVYAIACLAFIGSDPGNPPSRDRAVSGPIAVPTQVEISERAQILVHLTPGEVHVFTSNRPPEDKDLLDRVLPTDELTVLCDSVSHLTVNGKFAWKLVGNVRLQSTRMMIKCHEVVVTRDTKSLTMVVSGGDAVDASEAEKKRLKTESDGTVMVCRERRRDEPWSFESVLQCRTATIEQLFETGGTRTTIGAFGNSPSRKNQPTSIPHGSIEQPW